MAKKPNKNRTKKQNFKNSISTTADQENLENMELMKEVFATSMQRNLSFASATQQSFTSVSRDIEYLNRHTIYEDSFTREMVKVIIARAIGTTHDNIKPFQITLQSDMKISDKHRELMAEEFKFLVDIIDDKLIEIAMDAQFYGDGYAKVQAIQGEGVKSLVSNFSTKPFNITPFVSNFGREIAFEVAPNVNLLGGNKKTMFDNEKTINGRRIVTSTSLARMNAESSGMKRLTTDTLPTVERMNAFNDKETVHEDLIYGGVIEDCKESFDNYMWAVKSLANTRIASSVIERFITQNLGSSSREERKLLKKALETQIKTVSDKLKERVNEKDPSLLMANHIIPTTGENATNSLNIQESSPNFSGFQSVEDIMVHIKRYIADIGFNLELTPFAGATIGGNEKEGQIQSSIQMDVQGTQIRKSIRAFVKHIIRIHFLAKYNLEIDLSKVEVNFTSTLNQAKMQAEQQRLEALTNISQVGGVIEQMRGLRLEDTPENAVFLKDLLKDAVTQTTDNKEEVVDAMIKAIFTQPPAPEGEF